MKSQDFIENLKKDVVEIFVLKRYKMVSRIDCFFQKIKI
jgi:hypothetical protein